MAEVMKVYRQNMPAARFIGICYGDEQRVSGGFEPLWGEWFQKGRFPVLEALFPGEPADFYEDGSAYVGLMRWKENEPFQYWIGMFLPLNTDVPDGYGYVDFPASTLGVAWVYGKESEVYMKEEICGRSVEEKGMKIVMDKDGAYWFFERYACTRFTTPDKEGNVILDICHYIA